MEMLTFGALVVIGFAACSEFGSYAFVHPVIRRLSPADHIRVEQGLLKTFGRVMPVLMPLSGVLSVAFAVSARVEPFERTVRWAAALSGLASVLTTVACNVPINVATGRWDPEQLPDDWKVIRDRWERFQAIRTWLLLLGFVLLCLAVSLDS
jgi:hypothetical protein